MIGFAWTSSPGLWISRGRSSPRRRASGSSLRLACDAGPTRLGRLSSADPAVALSEAGAFISPASAGADELEAGEEEARALSAGPIGVCARRRR